MVISVVLEAITVSLVAPATSVIFRAADPEADLPAWLPEILAEQKRLDLILWIVIAGVLFIVVKNIFVGFQVRSQYRFMARVKQSISSRLLSRYLNAPYSFHLHRNSAQLIRNVINEVHELEARILGPWLMLLSEGLVCLGLVIVLLCLNPFNTLAVAGLLALAGLAYFLVTKGRLHRLGAKRMEAEEQRIRLVQQNLGAIKEIKLLGLEESSLKDYERHNRDSAMSLAAEAFFRQVPRLLLEVVAMAAVLLVVLISFVRGGATEELLASLAVLGAGAFRLLPSTNRIISAISSMRFGSIAVQNVAKELRSAGVSGSEKTESAPTGEDLVFSREIRIEEVTFTYPASEAPVLDKLSLTIPRNAFVAVIGESGSGKSTLVDLVLGLLTPDSGQILADDCPVHSHLRQWQQRLAYVPQDIFLSDLTIRENVAFGIPEDAIDDNRVREVLRLAHVEDFVASLPGGIRTEVGERGVRLSGGQRQRIGIARALYRDPEVIVFDEATSALDDDSQAKVMEAIRSLKGSRTIIMVSHRLSTIEYCDQVIDLVKVGRSGQGVQPAKARG